MDEAAEYIKACQVIFLHAPGLNKQIFLAESAPLAEQAHKIKSILFPNKKALYSEAIGLVKKLTEVKLSLKSLACTLYLSTGQLQQIQKHW